VFYFFASEGLFVIESLENRSSRLLIPSLISRLLIEGRIYLISRFLLFGAKNLDSLRIEKGPV